MGAVVVGALVRQSSHATATRCRPPCSCRATLCRATQRVEAGAQGEHKLQRGYLPGPTYSAHYIPDPGVRSVVESVLGYERREMAHVMAELTRQASPYKDTR